MRRGRRRPASRVNAAKKAAESAKEALALAQRDRTPEGSSKANTALAEAKAKQCLLIPVPLDRKGWDDGIPLERELKNLQTATWNAKPVLDFKPQRKGWDEVENSIKRAVELLRKGPIAALEN